VGLHHTEQKTALRSVDWLAHIYWGDLREDATGARGAEPDDTELYPDEEPWP
jgi:hypothetical protein